MSEPISMADAIDGKDRHMILEANRLKSFKDWPFTDGECTKEKMSASGFYHCNIVGEEDGVRCFCCLKELDGWDETDDPWAEHKRNNDCYFANLGKPQQKLTLKEFLKVLEEREVTLINKRFEGLKEIQKKTLEEYGLTVDE